MYIRRKVYSVLTDDYGYERLFSTNDIVLDDYEDTYVDDRLFAERDRDWADAALGAGAGLGVGGGLIGAYHGAKALEAKRVKGVEKAIQDYLAQEGNKGLVKVGKKKGVLGSVEDALAAKVEKTVKDDAGNETKKMVNKISGSQRRKLNELVKEANTPGKAGRLTNWVNEKIIGTAAKKGAKGTGLFRGNKKLAIAAALAAPAVAGGGIAYGVGHKNKD